MNNIMEYFICPVCGSKSTGIVGIKPLFDDVRVDVLRCTECSSEWRVYSEISNIEVEITKQGSTPEAPESEEVKPAVEVAE